MSFIQTANVASQASAAQLFHQTGATNAGAGNSPKVAPGADPESQFINNATNVSISPQAQAVMERIEAERKVAELLEKQLAGDTTETSVDIFFSSKSTDESTVEGDESGNLGLDALNSSFDDPQVAAKLGEIRERFMVGQVERKAGPEAAQAFKDALASGNVNVQKASDVPGVNYNTTITQIPGAGGTTGMRADTTFNPSPEIREAIDSGRAMVFWNIDAGDVYLTW